MYRAGEFGAVAQLGAQRVCNATVYGFDPHRLRYTLVAQWTSSALLRRWLWVQVPPRVQDKIMPKTSESVRRWLDSKAKVCSCGNKMHHLSRNCKKCGLTHNKVRGYEIRNMTIGEYRDRRRGHLRVSLHADIRNFSRTWNQDLRKKPCEICGYDKHVELCHIKAVSEWPDDTLLGVVNGPENLRVLCPSHHWEFDNGLLI